MGGCEGPVLETGGWGVGAAGPAEDWTSHPRIRRVSINAAHGALQIGDNDAKQAKAID